VVVCLERGADLNMAQLMPLPLTVSRLVLLFWYRLTRVVLNYFSGRIHSGMLKQRSGARLSVRLSAIFSDVNAVMTLAVRAASLYVLSFLSENR